MKSRYFKIPGIVVLCCLLLPTGRAAQPPAEQLLPAETLMVFTVKDFDQASADFWKTSMGRLWNDESMRPAREKFNARWTNEVTGALEKNFKVKLSDYTELLRGQLTFALTQPAQEDKGPGFLLLIDTKDKGDTLKTRLGELQKKWTEGDRKLKTDKIRDVEFTTYEFTQAALQQFARAVSGKGEAEADPQAATNKMHLLVGQSQSLLIIGTQTRDLEKALVRQSGGGAPSLAEQPVFQGNFNSLFRDAGLYAWLDFKPLFEQMIKPSGAVAAAAQSKGMENLRLQRILPALGLGDLKSIALRAGFGADGYDTTIFLTTPEANRQGLMKIMAPPAKDASPPPFVPADAVKFQRLRIDFQQAWSVFESVLMKIDPSVAGVVQLMIGAAGKDKDPDFDLKKSLIESIGDDFITYEKEPKNGNSPSISMVGAKNPEQLLNGVKVLMRMLPEPIGGAPLKEREFLGRKIYSLNLTPAGVPAPPGSEIQMVATANYLVVARDNAILEEYLRSADTPSKPLRDLPGLNDAAQKIGGMNTGWFSFENQAETMKAAVEDAKKNPDKEADESSFTLNVIGNRSSLVSDWVDYNSLPPFDKIAKYFYYSLLTASSTPEGISFKISAPTPPGLK